MRRNSFKVYRYNITIDGVSKTKEFPSCLNYKATIANLKASGHKEVWIDYLGQYRYEE